MRCVYSGACEPAASCADNFKISAEKEELERQSRPVKGVAIVLRSAQIGHLLSQSPKEHNMQITMKSLSYMNNLGPGRWLDLAKGHGW